MLGMKLQGSRLSSWAFVGLFLAALATGCSSNQNSLKMVGQDGLHDFSQTFSYAYISHNSNGDFDIVMVQDGDENRHDNPGKPLSPDAYALPHQIAHVRVYWNPWHTTKADHPVNTNASVHWYLMGDGNLPSDVLEYSGTGLAVVDNTKGGATVTIHKAWVKVASQRGHMVDPLGPAMLVGSVHAVYDPQKVDELIAQMKSISSNTADVQANPIPQPAHMSVNP